MATNNYMPMGRNPRSGGAGQAASYKKGGTTKVAGVMKKGGVKYQNLGKVKLNNPKDNTYVKPAPAIRSASQLSNTAADTGLYKQLAELMRKPGVANPKELALLKNKIRMANLNDKKLTNIYLPNQNNLKNNKKASGTKTIKKMVKK